MLHFVLVNCYCPLFATHLDAPLTADRMNEEESYYGIPVLTQEPGVAVANDNVDMVRKIVLCT